MIFSKKLSDTAPANGMPPDPPTSSGRARHHKLALLVTAGTVVTGLVLTTLFASGAFASTRAGGNRSGLAWASGVYLPNATPASLDTFGAWRGSSVDVATVWPNRASWSDIVSPTWLYQRWQGAPETIAFAEPMLPENVAGVSLQACANGSYNSYWRQFGTNISAYGLGNSVIRLGWEFNGNWYIWQASNPAVWVQCWQQIVTSARATAPGLQWDWNVNRGVSAGLADPTQAYPGDAYVNTIGVDSYDMWPPATTSAGWNTQLNGTQGLLYWLNFAKAHNKLFAVPEWGNMTTGTNPGGDDPAYVNDMLGFFQAHSLILAWESNFQSPSTGGTYGAGSSVPNASTAYKAGF